MTEPGSEELFSAIGECWAEDTKYASKDGPAGRPGDRSRGQCGTTALVMNDYLGGEILAAEVFREGEPVGHHYWNRLPDGTEVDLTGEQFLAGESLGPSRLAKRPSDLSGHPGFVPYRRLAGKVAEYLAAAGRRSPPEQP